MEIQTFQINNEPLKLNVEGIVFCCRPRTRGSAVRAPLRAPMRARRAPLGLCWTRAWQRPSASAFESARPSAFYRNWTQNPRMTSSTSMKIKSSSSKVSLPTFPILFPFSLILFPFLFMLKTRKSYSPKDTKERGIKPFSFRR